MSSTVASAGMFTVLEIAPEMKGWTAPIILMWPMWEIARCPTAQSNVARGSSSAPAPPPPVLARGHGCGVGRGGDGARPAGDVGRRGVLVLELGRPDDRPVLVDVGLDLA